jgi:lysophospholipase L1-like esterase
MIARRSLVAAALLAALGLGSFVSVRADDKPANPCVVPANKLGEGWWKDRHAQKLEVIKKGDAKLLFIGDSITHGWEGEGKETWAKMYEPRHAVNLGYGGDQTQHVLWRLENGEIDGIKPTAAVIMIGTNNGGDSAENVAAGITAIVQKLQEKHPDIKILLLDIFPRGEKDNGHRQKNEKTNAIISKLDDGKKVFYLDIGPKFLTADGTLTKDIMPDALHPNKHGYEIEAEAIEPSIKKIMGE